MWFESDHLSWNTQRQSERTAQCAQSKANQPERHWNEFLSTDGNGREAAKKTENAIFFKKNQKESVAFPGVTYTCIEFSLTLEKPPSVSWMTRKGRPVLWSVRENVLSWSCEDASQQPLRWSIQSTCMVFFLKKILTSRLIPACKIYKHLTF